jgi:hypothetical protein
VGEVTDRDASDEQDEPHRIFSAVALGSPDVRPRRGQRERLLSGADYVDSLAVTYRDDHASAALWRELAGHLRREANTPLWVRRARYWARRLRFSLTFWVLLIGMWLWWVFDPSHAPNWVVQVIWTAGVFALGFARTGLLRRWARRG